MSWTFALEFDAAHQAALDRGRPFIYVAPPAGWILRPLLEQLPVSSGSGMHTLIVVADSQTAVELRDDVASTASLGRTHAVSGLDRSARLLGRSAVGTLITTPQQALQLLARSQLQVESLARILVCWPEAQLPLDSGPALDSLLSECRSAQRIIVTADERAAADFVERHARRAAVLSAARPPDLPRGSARYAIVPAARVVAGVRTVLDITNPDSVLLWDPSSARQARWAEYEEDESVTVTEDPGAATVDLAVAAELPTAAMLAGLRESASEVILLVRPGQLSYLRSMVDRLTALRLPGESDRAREWQAALRQRVRERIDQGTIEPTVLALSPLLEEYDPVLVAAAMVEIPPTGTPTGPTGLGDLPLWTHVRLSLGRRDQVRTSDVVGALLNAAGLTKNAVGKVDVRESFTVVEVRAEAGERARQGLDGLTLRGRTVSARFDRK